MTGADNKATSKDNRRPVQLAVGIAMLLVGVLIRLPIADYRGAPDQGAFNGHLLDHFGSYSDIASLYFRDRIWEHALPYVAYPFEYPVLTGVLQWVTGFGTTTVWSYLLVNALVLGAAGIVCVYLVTREAGRRAWLLVVAPALAFYVVLNWDFLAVAFMLGALLMFDRDRDIEGAGLLTLAIWAKFFPLVLVPLVLAHRWGTKTFWRIVTVVASGSVLLNLPFALERTDDGLGLRDGWLHFFVFTRDRGRELNVWNLFDDAGLTTQQINTWSGLLSLAGILLVAFLVYRNRDRPFLPVLATGALASLAWLFFWSKVYSPQYGLWLIVLIPLALVPLGLGAYFVGIDAFYFATSFLAFVAASDWFYDQVLIPSMVVRELTLLALVIASVSALTPKLGPPAST